MIETKTESRKLHPFEDKKPWGIVMTCGVDDRIEKVKTMTAEDLRVIVSDPEVQLTVRLAAERRLRKIYVAGKMKAVKV